MHNVQDRAASARAYEAVKRRILSGDLPGGVVVSELTLSQEAGISRTPMHEAFLRLSAEGLLSLEARKGAIVRPMSPSEAADVLEMREAIESAAARRMIGGGATAKLSPVLIGLLEAQRRAVLQGDIEQFVDLDDEFHMTVVTASGNEIAVRFMRLLRDRQQRLRHQLMRVQPDQLASALTQHEDLAHAVASGDATGYARLLNEHVSMHRGAL